MQLTRLRLTGFKSFVDATELVIAPGLTGVVGPNGCGKSNLLEALRWVMGENRPTAMRGEGMEDVIFAGAESRPSRHYAEVALTLDNSARAAPQMFNDADQIEVLRRITREAGSVYRANGREVRARDVQMLFADASTGAHSPALVRQGQIAELINARPADRRRILEEAAGIAGLYQRRHEAELKLKGAETNLARVADILEQLETQLRGLERQARQAARYREIAADLRRAEILHLLRLWRDAEAARTAADSALTAATLGAGEALALNLRATRTREEAEAALPALREEDMIAGALAQRLTLERAGLEEAGARAEAAITALEGEAARLAADRAREEALGHDAAETTARLGAERQALEQAAAGHDARLGEARALAAETAVTLTGRENALDEATAEAARLSARLASLTRQIAEAEGAEGRIAAALAQAESEAEACARDLAEATRSRDLALTAEAERALAAASAERALAGAEADRAAVLAADYDARSALAQVEGEHRAVEGELGALRSLLARDDESGTHVITRLSVTPGYEAALGAALGDDLRAPLSPAPGQEGWADTGPGPDGGAFPGIRLADHVSGAPALAARLSRVFVVAPDQGDALQARLGPGQRLVSPEGDLWRWDGFRRPAGAGQSTAGLRLRQANRLKDLSENAARLSGLLDRARTASETAHLRLTAAQEAEQQARAERRAADEAATAATRDLGRAEADCARLAVRQDGLAETLTRLRSEGGEARVLTADARAKRADLGDLAELDARAAACRAAVEEARSAMLAARGQAEELRREAEARAKRLGEITRETGDWTSRAARAGERLAELADRADATARKLAASRAEPARIRARAAELGDSLAAAEARRKTAADALASGEARLRSAAEAEREASAAAARLREDRARLEAQAEAAAARSAEAVRHITTTLDSEPAQLLASIDGGAEALPEAARAEADVARLTRQREALGPVNLLAEEESRAVAEQALNLATEKADLEAGIAKLRQGIAGLNKEGRQRLLEAFEQVNANFSELFRHLFGGGEARLVLVESDDPLEAGLEILCQPPGKKLATLSLLSGGEQTLTALSLVFAVFRANPAPVCVLDEVDAPLDDANVTRFCDLLDEMARTTATRFLIITHHAVTMSRMDRLFGVTMAEKGVSQLVSVDLSRAAKLVA